MSFVKFIITVGFLVFPFSLKAELTCEGMDISGLSAIDFEFETIEEKDKKSGESLSDEEFILQGTDKRHLGYQRVYEYCLKPLLDKYSDLSNLSADELLELFTTISHTQFYTASSKQALQMLAILEAMKVKADNDLTETLLFTAKKVSRALIRARQFDELSELATKYDDIPLVKFDGTNEKSKRNIMVQATDGSSFALSAFEFSQKGQVIVTSNPFCGFSQEARQFLSKDKQYSSIFSEHATWLIPADGNLYFEGVSEDPQQEIFPFVYTYKLKEWPEIDYWGTPAFYFYKDGALKYKVIGWGNGREKYIEQGLKKIGLL